MKRAAFIVLVPLIFVLTAMTRPTPAADAAAAGGTSVQQAVDRAVEFLRTKAQAPDGSYSAASGPGVTAIVAAAILRNGRSPDDPLLARSLKYLEGFVQPDGGIYQPKTFHRTMKPAWPWSAFTRPTATAATTS